MLRLFNGLLLSIIIFLSTYFLLVAQELLTVTVNDLGYSGLLFMSLRDRRTCTVFDSDGNILYEYSEVSCLDFKILDDGDWIFYDSDNREWQEYLPYSSTLVMTYTISGSNTDGHDIIVKDNYVWLMGREEYVAVSGTLAITLNGSTVQKQDLSGNMLFDWHSKDHIGLDERTVFDNRSYPHSNSFYADDDGNLIVSFRHTNSIVKICITGDGCDPGEVIWRLGGKKSDFAFTNDGGIARQHSALMADTCHAGASRCLILFDNGEPGSYSRAVEYVLDETQGIVTKTWEYTANGAIFAPTQGNVKRLDNGDTVIGWGSARRDDPDAPTVSVVDWDANVKYEAMLPEGMVNYRAHLYLEWRRVYLPVVARLD